ncbi:MAG: hypothetical protein KGH64_01440 [Candidatus Micrarchaeota archaeon]|nr:hypothetical protein [Candidatus Micrarchaeota archaeon]MDE1858969.1 hypothetical protein [Candidatus Micrarchaeota archaeon]
MRFVRFSIIKSEMGRLYRIPIEEIRINNTQLNLLGILDDLERNHIYTFFLYPTLDKLSRRTNPSRRSYLNDVSELKKLGLIEKSPLMSTGQFGGKYISLTAKGREFVEYRKSLNKAMRDQTCHLPLSHPSRLKLQNLRRRGSHD